MLRNKAITILIVYLVLSGGSIFAKEKKATQEKYTVEGHYKYFEENYTPRELFNKAEQAALFLSGECKKGKKSCDRAIDVFNKPNTKWNVLDARHPLLFVNNTEKHMVVAHPNSKLHKIRFVPDLAKKIKDFYGRYSVLSGFNKLRANKKAAWFDQYTTWIRSVTGLKDPVYSINVVVAVPETPYNVLAAMPYRASSITEIELKAATLDSQIKYWSIIK